MWIRALFSLDRRRSMTWIVIRSKVFIVWFLKVERQRWKGGGICFAFHLPVVPFSKKKSWLGLEAVWAIFSLHGPWSFSVLIHCHVSVRFCCRVVCRPWIDYSSSLLLLPYFCRAPFAAFHLISVRWGWRRRSALCSRLEKYKDIFIFFCFFAVIFQPFSTLFLL